MTRWVSVLLPPGNAAAEKNAETSSSDRVFVVPELCEFEPLSVRHVRFARNRMLLFILHRFQALAICII